MFCKRRRVQKQKEALSVLQSLARFSYSLNPVVVTVSTRNRSQPNRVARLFGSNPGFPDFLIHVVRRTHRQRVQQAAENFLDVDQAFRACSTTAHPGERPARGAVCCYKCCYFSGVFRVNP